MRFFRACPALAAVCLCVSAGPLLSQARVLREITFTGAPAYSQAELLAFTGLKPGTSATQQQLEDVAQRLNDTGAFEEVSFSGNDKGIVYALKPAAANALLPARFGNFVWWQDEEINHSLHATVPLYRATSVPIAGNLRESICAALKAMLIDKGVPAATVVSLRSASRPNGPLDGLAFTIDSPAVLVHSLTLLAASPAMQPKLTRVINDMTGKPWDKATTYPDIESRVGDVYRNDGYVDIAIVKQDHSAPAIAANSINLDITATITEGAQYHVAQLTWPGSDVLSVSDFNKKATLKKGDPDSPSALRESLHNLATAYSVKGYIDAKVDAPPVIDRTAHLVAYTVSVIPGDQYHVKSVRFIGFSEAQQKSIDAAWHMKAGDIYDATYANKFINQNPDLRKPGYNFGVTEKRDRSALTVELTVTWNKAAAPSRPN